MKRDTNKRVVHQLEGLQIKMIDSIRASLFFVVLIVPLSLWAEDKHPWGQARTLLQNGAIQQALELMIQEEESQAGNRGDA